MIIWECGLLYFLVGWLCASLDLRHNKWNSTPLAMFFFWPVIAGLSGFAAVLIVCLSFIDMLLHWSAGGDQPW